MFKVIALVVMLAIAGEYLYRKFGPKVKAEVVAVDNKVVAVKKDVAADVAAVKADVAKVEAKLP